MQRVLLLLMALMASITFVMAQTDFVYPELISKDSIELLTAHNGQLITLKKDKKRNFFLSVNNKTDTLKINFPFNYWEIIPVHYNTDNNIYVQFSQYKNKSQIKSVYKLNLETKTFIKIKELGEYDIVYFIINNDIIFRIDFDNNLYAYNMQTTRADSLFDGGESFGITRKFILDNKILMCYWESGTIEDFSFFDFSTRQEIYPIELLKDFSYSDKADVDTYFRDITEKYYNVGLFWVDGNFNVIQPTLLPYYTSFASYNLIGTTPQFCYRSSYIEHKLLKNQVWIACRFSLSFDKALYDIYHNAMLEKTIVETFDEWELNKLRNMVFAKHGCRFKSDYLQAFFNLFDFYNNIDKKDDVTNLLTPMDKKNLELIRQAENKVKSRK